MTRSDLLLDAWLVEKLHLWKLWASCAVVGLHLAGMVWHRLVKRDSVLAMMLPGLR